MRKIISDWRRGVRIGWRNAYKPIHPALNQFLHGGIRHGVMLRKTLEFSTGLFVALLCIAAVWGWLVILGNIGETMARAV